MTNRRNYYRILHVQSDAPIAVIKASYRALMQKLKLHPDLGGDDWNAIVLNEAYATLSNDGKRKAYDAQLQTNPKKQINRPNSTGEQVKQTITPVLRIARNEPQCPFCGTDTPDNTHPHTTNDCVNCNSPLKSSTDHFQSINSAGRALERQLQNAPIMYFTEANKPAQFGILRDLSPLGLQFELSEPLNNEQVIKLVCDALTAIVRVKNCRQHVADGHYVVGVEFLTSRFNNRRGTFFYEAAC